MSNVTELPAVHSIPVGRFLTTSGWKASSSGCLFDIHTAMVQTDAEGRGRLLLAVDTEDDPMLSGFELFAAVWEYAALSDYGRLLYQPPRSISPDEVTTGEVPTTELNPNPPKDTDGRREGSGRGWVRELQGRWPGVLG